MKREKNVLLKRYTRKELEWLEKEILEVSGRKAINVQKEEQDMEDKNKSNEKYYITLPEKFGRKVENEERSFVSMRIPDGVRLKDGTDVGGYWFASSFGDVKDGNVYAVFYKGDWEITLNKNKRLENGDYEKLPPLVVQVEELAEVIQVHQRNYKMQHCFVVPESFVKERKGKEESTYLSVTIPKGVKAEGEDIGGYRFNIHKGFASEARNGYMKIRFKDDTIFSMRKYEITTDDDGNRQTVLDEEGKPKYKEVEMTGEALKTALEQAHQAYIEEISDFYHRMLENSRRR